MTRKDEWEVFRAFPERGPADALCAQLRLAEIPSKVEPRALENAIETQYCVFVASYLAHRARWVVAQLPPTEEELNYLATGKLPGAE